VTAATGANEETGPAIAAFLRKRDEVVASLRGLADVAGALGTKTVRDRIESRLVGKLEADRFHLVVVGEFNHGKTTFVNALLGQRALPVGVTPTTSAIHHIRWAERPEAFVITTAGERREIPFEAARHFAAGGSAATAEVDHVEIGYPASLLKERIVLVDTPGVNDLSLQRADITYSYIPRADAVLFLLDAGQILKESERVFLNERLLKASRDKIVFVITKWDLLSPDERREALAYAKRHLSALVKEPVVFPVSAETALGGAVAESGMQELCTHLIRFLAEERGRILLDNALGGGLAIAALLSKGVDARRRAIQMNDDEIERRAAALEQDLMGRATTIEQRRRQILEDVSAIKTAARKDLERFVDDVCRQLPHVIDSAKADDLKEFLPAFLQDSFKRWAEQETREIAVQLEQLGERTAAFLRDDARDSARGVAEALGRDARRLDVEVDTIRYDVGVVALLFGGVALMAVNLMVGGLLATAGPAIFALFARGKIHEEFKKRAKQLAPEVMREAADKVAPKLDALIDEVAQKLEAWVVSAGEELHREMLEILRSTREARAVSPNDDAQARGLVEEQAVALAKKVEELEALRAALWAKPEVPALAAAS
jgi:small GTP-binding protein